MKKILLLAAVCVLVQLSAQAQGYIKRIRDREEKKTGTTIHKKKGFKTGNSPTLSSLDSSHSTNTYHIKNKNASNSYNKTGADSGYTEAKQKLLECIVLK